MMFNLENEPPMHVVRLREVSPRQNPIYTDIIRCGDGGYVWASPEEAVESFSRVAGMSWAFTADIAHSELMIVEQV